MGQSSYKHNSKQKIWNFNWSNKHNGKYANDNNLFQGDTNSGSTKKVTICLEAGKNIILVGSTSKCPDSSKTKTLCKEVAISNKGSEYFKNCEEMSNSFFFSQPLQPLPREINLNLKEKSLVAEEIGNLLKKVAIEKSHMKEVFAKNQFVSNLFLMKKKDGGSRPVINLKNLNQYIPHHHFKMERLQPLRDILKQGNLMWKLVLKDAYFCIPLVEESKKFVIFYWKADLYQFMCLCFGLAPAPYIFTKLLKILFTKLLKIPTAFLQ